MKKPTIGVMPLYDEEKDSIWMIPGYMDAIADAGGLPVILPLTSRQNILSQAVEICDGFLLTGGQDVDPILYGKSRTENCGRSCLDRDCMEKFIFNMAMVTNKSVLGICRGIQIINSLLGGTLYQDLPTERPMSVNHRMTPPYDRVQHTVTVLDDTPLSDIVGKGTIGVNSYHHQAVDFLSLRLKPAALSEDGIIEAAYMPDKKFILAVQWHPELSYRTDPAAKALFTSFVKSCVEETVKFHYYE